MEQGWDEEPLVQVGSQAEPHSLCIQPEPTLICFHAELRRCHGKQKWPGFPINPAHAKRRWLRGAHTVESIVFPVEY